MSISLLLGIPGKIKKLSDTLTRVENTVNNFSGGVISNADYANVKTYADVRLALPADTYTPLKIMNVSDLNSKPRYTLGTGWVIGTPVSIYTANTKLAFGSLEIKGRQFQGYSHSQIQTNNLTVQCEFIVKINPKPEAYNTSLFQCDEDGLPDGFTMFNLNEAIPDLTGGVRLERPG